MLKFKTFLLERKRVNMINNITPMLRQKFDKAISPFTYTVKNATTKTTTIIVRAPKDDRGKVKKDIEAKLKTAKIDYASSNKGGSTGSTDVLFDKHNVKITYKPISGGMSETTLNATITELAPALAFMANKKFTGPTAIKNMYAFLASTTGNKYNVYVNNRDAIAGADFISTMPSSSKFEDKMENALAILDYLYDENEKSPISQVYWGYRAKPAGIPSTHKGDLFIQYKTGNWIGVSLKAGGAKTAEPQLNTYVNKFFDDYGRGSEKTELKDKVYKEIHSTIGLPADWQERSKKAQSIETIIEYEKTNEKGYEALYDKMLDMIRTNIVKQVNSNKNDTIDYIQKQVLKKDENVPLVVVKAFDQKYKFVTDEDQLETFLPKVSSINATVSSSSKQNWFIELKSGKTESIKMNMSVRSNQPKPNNKIAQGFNLAIKFNGLA